MGKLFVHIGLPKTATTTLQQQTFPLLDDKKVRYIGVAQPRSDPQSVEYRLIVDAINSGRINSARRWLIKSSEYGYSLLLSEEGILVSESQHTDWRTKLKNLSTLVEGLDYELIVTVREPVAAMFSYFVELYSEFSKDGKSFIDLAMYDPRMEIFHYAKLFNEILRHFEKNRIFVKKFEDIALGEINDLVRLLTGDDFRVDPEILSIYNSKVEENGYILTGKIYTVKDLAKEFIERPRVANSELYLKTKRIVSPLLQYLDILKLKKIKVPKLTNNEREQLSNYLRHETCALGSLYGISYD